jgi:c-di-GMP-binding flagellar brake protein YcgR
MTDSAMSETPPQTDSERRRRLRSAISIEVKLYAPEFHFVLLSRTIDLSTSGAFVRSNRTLPLGSVVTVHFERGEARNPLAVEAEVVRVGTAEQGRASGIGLRFRGVDDLDEALLQEIILRARS